MNLNKISCQKYVLSTFELEFIPYLELSIRFASQIRHENINKPLDGAYLADFGIYNSLLYMPFQLELNFNFLLK